MGRAGPPVAPAPVDPEAVGGLGGGPQEHALEHRRRVEARYAARDHEGIPDWVRVLERQAEYEPYLGPRLVVDTYLAKDPVGPVVNYLR